MKRYRYTQKMTLTKVIEVEDENAGRVLERAEQLLAEHGDDAIRTAEVLNEIEEIGSL